MDQGCGRHNSSHILELVFLKFPHIEGRQLRCCLWHSIRLHWTVMEDCKDSVTCETSWSWVKTGSNQDAVTVKQHLFACHILFCLVCKYSVGSMLLGKWYWPLHCNQTFSVWHCLSWVCHPSSLFMMIALLTFWHCVLLHYLKKYFTEFHCIWWIVQT
jgi:hypothetical protein